MPPKGFTLIEVLIALVLVSVMSLLAWRAIEGMGRAGELTTDHEQQLTRIEAALTQWAADLDAVVDTGIVPALDFDGQSLRMTRNSIGDSSQIMVVAWTLRTTEKGRIWQRWTSPAVNTKNGLEAIWNGASRWARTPLPEDSARSVALFAVQNWQVFYFRDNAWSHPQSSTGTTPNNSVMPDGVQLVLDVPSDSDMRQAGKLTKYWIRPTLGATR